MDNREAINRLEGIIESTDDNIPIVWHRTCYSVFTSKQKIDRFQKKCVENNTSEPSVSSPCITRRGIGKCVFFVRIKPQEKRLSAQLQNITTDYELDWQVCLT